MNDRTADTVVVLDFETSGLSPNNGDRAIEVGAVLLEQGRITAQFQKLMNPGFRVNAFIERYTGISNTALQKADSCAVGMGEFAEFIADHNLIAHNASFDQRFLDDELQRIGMSYSGTFCCSLLLARRLFPSLPNHQLGTLVRALTLPTQGTYHRALADAQMTAHLWLALVERVRYVRECDDVPFSLMKKLSKVSKKSVMAFLSA